MTSNRDDARLDGLTWGDGDFELSMARGYTWLTQHSANFTGVIAWPTRTLPFPATAAWAALHALADARERIAELERRLAEIDEIADDRADADQEPGGTPTPNDWMRVQTIARGEDKP